MMDYHNPNDFWSPGDPDLYKDLEDDERIAATICHIVMMVLMFLVVFAVMAMCSSCTTTKYVPVPEYHTDTLIVTQHQRDSIWMHDSIRVTEKGDTVRIEKWHTKYVQKDVHDTTYISKHDTVPQPYPVTEYVEKPLEWWQKTLMYLGGLLIVIFGIWVWRTK